MPAPEVLAVLGATRGPAGESTFRRAFALVSADVLDRVTGAWLWTRAMQSRGQPCRHRRQDRPRRENAPAALRFTPPQNAG